MEKIKKHNNWLRVQLMSLAIGKVELLNLLHAKLPADSKQLNKFLNEHKPSVLNVLSKESVNAIYSTNDGHNIYSLAFSISICSQLLYCFQHLGGIPKCYPLGKGPNSDKIDKGAHIWRLAELQRELQVAKTLDMNDAEFKVFCNRLGQIFIGLGYTKPIDDFITKPFTECCKLVDHVFELETLKNAAYVEGIKSLGEQLSASFMSLVVKTHGKEKISVRLDLNLDKITLKDFNKG